MSTRPRAAARLVTRVELLTPAGSVRIAARAKMRETGLRDSAEAVREAKEAAVETPHRISVRADLARVATRQTAERWRSIRSEVAATKVEAQQLRAESSDLEQPPGS